MSQEAKKLLSELSFCAFDLETTGGNLEKDKIIEIGMVKISNLKIVEEKSFLINPEIKIPDFIQKLTSIGPKDIEEAPRIEEVIDEVLTFMGDSVLIAHNTSFDVPFFDSVLKRAGKNSLTNKSICTNLMTKYLIPNLLNSNLNYMSKIFGIPHKKAHRALDDAKAAAKLFLKYADIFIDKDIQKINHLYYPRNRFELDRVNFDSKAELKILEASIDQIKTPYLITVKGAEGVILLALPQDGTKKDNSFLKEKLRSLSWERVTIRTSGSFLETVVSFGSIFLKIDAINRSELLHHLEEIYLTSSVKSFKGGAYAMATSESHKEQYVTSILGDFVIFPHLVPEQFIIFPIISIHERNGLIFRYPGHKKKLLQFIATRAGKGVTKRSSKNFLPDEIREFIFEYLAMEKASGNKSLFLFEKKIAMKNPMEFTVLMENFLAENPNSYNYPKDHIKKHYH